MNAFMIDFMNKLDFPEEAKIYLKDKYDISVTQVINNRLEILKSIYMNQPDDRAVISELRKISNKINLHIYTVNLLFLIFCAESLKEKYNRLGLDEKLYWDIMSDVKYKLLECYTVYGIWGTFVFEWFHRHYLTKLFALGRFQYERVGFVFDIYEKNGIRVKRGDNVYNFHIPSSGPIPKEERIDSYKKAFDFFKDHDNRYIVLVCDSWLLYPDNKNIFPKGSNLISFFKDFTIIESESYKGFPDAWRVFGMGFCTDTDKLPQNTTLQKNFVKWLSNGNKVGHGCGVIIFDGEKII